jgi:hypothetical protein
MWCISAKIPRSVSRRAWKRYNTLVARDLNKKGLLSVVRSQGIRELAQYAHVHGRHRIDIEE